MLEKMQFKRRDLNNVCEAGGERKDEREGGYISWRTSEFLVEPQLKSRLPSGQICQTCGL